MPDTCAASTTTARALPAAMGSGSAAQSATIIVPSFGVAGVAGVVGVVGVVVLGPLCDGTSPGVPVGPVPAAPATVAVPERVPAPAVGPLVDLDPTAPPVAPLPPVLEPAWLGLLAPAVWLDGPFWAFPLIMPLLLPLSAQPAAANVDIVHTAAANALRMSLLPSSNSNYGF